jgi:hypothetical protein
MTQLTLIMSLLILSVHCNTINNNNNNRVLLTSCAALLHGFDTRKDPLLNALIVCYSLEQVTQGMALAALALLDDVMGNDDVSSNAKSDNAKSNGKNWLDGGLKGLLDASSDSAVQPSCAEIASSAFEFFAELSKSVHSPATAQSPTSVSGSSDSTSSTDSSSGALVRSSTAVATTGVTDSTTVSTDDSSGTSGSELADSGSQEQPGKKKRVWPFGQKNRKHSHAEQLPPMGHDLVVQRCDHLSTGAKVVLNTVRLLRKRGASVRAAKARKAEGAYQWGGDTNLFKYLKLHFVKFAC